MRPGQAGIEDGIAQFPGQDEGIAQPQVEPLACNRMQHLCRVADPHLAGCRGLPAADAGQRHGHGRCADPQRPEVSGMAAPVAGAQGGTQGFTQFLTQSIGWQFGTPAAGLGGITPDHGVARAIGQGRGGQQGQRTAGAETLEGRVGRAGHGHLKQQAGLAAVMGVEIGVVPGLRGGHATGVNHQGGIGEGRVVRSGKGQLLGGLVQLCNEVFPHYDPA